MRHVLYLLCLLCFVSNITACGADDAGNNANIDGSYTRPPTSNAGGQGSTDQQVAGQLTAGQWHDLEHWSYWLELVEEPSQWRGFLDAWGLVPTSHTTVIVNGADGPLPDRVVELRDAADDALLWSARTDHQGTARLFSSFFGQAPPTGAYVTVSGQKKQVPDLAASTITISMDEPSVAPSTLDVMFVIDVTSSMLDEQSYLKAEMSDVMARLKMARPTLNIRTSVNFYCDPGEFTVKSHPFKPIDEALNVLNQGASCNGGDYPEAVDEGLANAIEEHQWSDDAIARVLFLVLDAPPHADQEGKARLKRFVKQAAARGVKLVPIVSSGADKEVEFLMRSMVIGTNGAYVFLTNHSGIGDKKIEPTIGDYKVEYLNELMLNLLLKETSF